MALTFKNPDCQVIYAQCVSELSAIDTLLKNKSPGDKDVPYLTRYAIIVSASTLENICKTMIADYCESGANAIAKQYIYKTFRKKPLNVKYKTLCSTINNFNDKWRTDFKTDIKSKKNGQKWIDGLNSLVDLRNSFAHGGRPTNSFNEVHDYFKRAVRVIMILERKIK